MNAIALGAWMFKRALGSGATFAHDRVTSVVRQGGRVRGVGLASGRSIDTDRIVIAAGPALPNVARLLELELPVFHELHAKLTLRDSRRLVSRDIPFLIWSDPVTLPWAEAERTAFAKEPDAHRLMMPFPGGVHVRPIDGPHGDELYVIWTYDIEPRPFAWPPSFDPHYGEIAIRGLARMLPAVTAYFGHGRSGLVDGGYYCKTRENRPLVGPLPVEGAFVLGALSGFGIMGSHAGGDLVAAHLTSSRLPDYARWFHPSRYDDATYCADVERWGANVGQL
jgi:glycine/D-amino acid oxidase-like deaminating enzyme